MESIVLTICTRQQRLRLRITLRTLRSAGLSYVPTLEGTAGFEPALQELLSTIV